MFRFVRHVVVAAAVAAFVVPWPAEASIGTQPLKPDLWILSLGRSSSDPTVARVMIMNSGAATTMGCVVRLIVNPGTPFFTGVDHYIAPMAGNSARTVYIDVGPALAECGAPVLGKVDFYGVINESDEADNSKWYVTPPC